MNITKAQISKDIEELFDYYKGRERELIEIIFFNWDFLIEGGDLDGDYSEKDIKKFQSLAYQKIKKDYPALIYFYKENKFRGGN